MNKKNLVISIISTFCLTSIIFLTIPVHSYTPYTYDPWLDVNDDGKINLIDTFTEELAYGTSGGPVNKTALLYDVNATFTELLSEIGSSNASLNDLRNRVTALENNMITNTSLVDLLSRIDSLNASLIDVQNRVTSVEDKQSVFETTMNQLENNVTILQGSIDSLSSAVTILESTVATLQTNFDIMNASFASLNDRISALEANYSVTNLQLAPNAIPFNSTCVDGYIDTTPSLNWQDLNSTSVNITLQRTSHLLIFFSADASNNLFSNAGDYCIKARALVEGSTALPDWVYLTPIVGATGFTGLPDHRHTLGYASYSFNFYKPLVVPGTYTIKMQWCVTGGTGYMQYRTLTVIALPA